VEVRLEVVAIRVLIGGEHEHKDDAGTSHEHDGESRGVAHGKAFTFQQSVTRRHRCGGGRGCGRP